MPKAKITEIDVTFPHADQARQAAVTAARAALTHPVVRNVPMIRQLANAVLWLNFHLSHGGPLPTQWAIDGTATPVDQPLVTDIDLPPAHDADVSAPGRRAIAAAIAAAQADDIDAIQAAVDQLADSDLPAAEIQLGTVFGAVRARTRYRGMDPRL